MSKNFDVRAVKELVKEVKQNYISQIEIAKQEKEEELSFTEKVELRNIVSENVSKQKFPQRMELLSPIEELSNLIFCICQRSTVNRKPIYYACIEEKPVAFIFWSGKRWVLDDEEDLQAPYRQVLNDDPFSPIGEYVGDFEGQKIPFTIQETEKESECSVEPVGAYPKFIRITVDFQGSGTGDGEEGFGTLTRSDIITESLEGLPETINGVPYYGGYDERQGNIFLYFGEEGWTFDNDTEEPGFFGLSGNKLRILGAYQVSISGLVTFTITESESGTIPENINLVSSLPMEYQIDYTWMEGKVSNQETTQFVYFSGQLQEGTQIYFDSDLSRPFNSDSAPTYRGKTLYNLVDTELIANLYIEQVIFDPETGSLNGNQIQMALDDSGIILDLFISSSNAKSEIQVNNYPTSYQINSIFDQTAVGKGLIFNMNLNNVYVSDWGKSFDGVEMPSYINLSNISLQVASFSTGMGWSGGLSLEQGVFFIAAQDVSEQVSISEIKSDVSSTIFNVMIGDRLRTLNIESLDLSVMSPNSIDTEATAIFPQYGNFSNISGSISISSPSYTPVMGDSNADFGTK